MDSYIQVVMVNPDSLGEKIGIEVGDKIVSYNEVPINSLDSLQKEISNAVNCGISNVELVIARGDRQYTYDVAVGQLGVVCKSISVDNECNIPTPVISYIFYSLSILTFFGGIVLAGDSDLADQLNVEPYSFAIMWIVSGAIGSAMLAAIAKVLLYLNRISVILENKSKNR